MVQLKGSGFSGQLVFMQVPGEVVAKPLALLASPADQSGLDAMGDTDGQSGRPPLPGEEVLFPYSLPEDGPVGAGPVVDDGLDDVHRPSPAAYLLHQLFLL